MYFSSVCIFTPVMVELNEMSLESIHWSWTTTLDRVRGNIEELDCLYDDDYQLPLHGPSQFQILLKIITCLWTYIKAKKTGQGTPIFLNMLKYKMICDTYAENM
jgi:hypothetical protein